MSIKTDQEIIHEIIEGNINAYTLLLNKYKKLVFTLAYNILLNREDAEDITQEAFINAYKNLRSFKGSSAFSTWLYRIAVNVALNKKKLKKFSFTEVENVFEDTEVKEVALCSFDKIEVDDRKKYVQLAMKSLKEDERICVTLFYLNELQIAEIQELTGLSASNIKVLLHRGRKNIYYILEQLLRNELLDFK